MEIVLVAMFILFGALAFYAGYKFGRIVATPLPTKQIQEDSKDSMDPKKLTTNEQIESLFSYEGKRQEKR